MINIHFLLLFPCVRKINPEEFEANGQEEKEML